MKLEKVAITNWTSTHGDRLFQRPVQVSTVGRSDTFFNKSAIAQRCHRIVRAVLGSRALRTRAGFDDASHLSKGL
jgi:hypothetical protein